MKFKTNGFTLMEVLVALAVLSIGLLGIAGMQLFSLKSNQDSGMRTQATYLAYSLIDKIRANRDEALAGGYDINIGDGPGASQDCFSNNCTTNQLAEFELNLWKCELGNFASDAVCTSAPFNVTPLLPAGDGSISIDAINNEVTVTVQWLDSANREDLNLLTTPPQSLQIVAQL